MADASLLDRLAAARDALGPNSIKPLRGPDAQRREALKTAERAALALSNARERARRAAR